MLLNVTDYSVKLRWEIKRCLEVFLKNGSYTATVSRLEELTLNAIHILLEFGFCRLDMGTVDSAKADDVVAEKSYDTAMDAAMILKMEAEESDKDLTTINNEEVLNNGKQLKDFDAMHKVVIKDLDNARKAAEDAAMLLTHKFDAMDFGDQSGRYRIVIEKSEDANELILQIMRSVKPKAK